MKNFMNEKQRKILSSLGVFASSGKAISAAKKFENNIIDEVKASTVIVTGANSGVGKGIATTFAKLGSTVVLACRSIPKAENAVKEILKEVPSLDKDKLQIIALDLSSLDSIPKFVTELNAKISSNEIPQVRVLIANAGILPFNYNKTADGVEQCFGVNHLGHYFLFEELLQEPTLFADNKLRLVSVSSENQNLPIPADMTNRKEIIEKVAHLTSKDMSKTFSIMKNYGSSKLCNVLFARYATDKVFNKTYVTANSICPGVVNTNVGNESFIVRWTMPIIGRIFFKNIDQGGATAVITSLLPDEVFKEKLYFCSCKPCEAATAVEGEKGLKAEETLWQLSADLCELFRSGKSLLEINQTAKL